MLGKIGLSVSRADSSRVYAEIEAVLLIRGVKAQIHERKAKLDAKAPLVKTPSAPQ